MTPAGVGLTVFLGTIVGLALNYPHAALEGYLVVGAMNGGFAWFLGLLVMTGLKIMGVVSDDEPPTTSRR